MAQADPVFTGELLRSRRARFRGKTADAFGDSAAVLIEQAFVSSPSWSRDGVILYSSNAQVFAISPEDAAARKIAEYGSALDPAWSPDGYRIAYGRADVDRGLWVMNAGGKNPRQLTLFEDRYPNWSPTGVILVQRTIGTLSAVYFVSADGSKATQLVTELEMSQHPSW